MLLEYLIKLFGLYSRGKIFTADNVRCIRRIGIVILIYNLLFPLYEMLMTFILTMNNPVGERLVRLGFGGTDIAQIVIAIMIILISWIMDEGRKMEEEQAYTV